MLVIYSRLSLPAQDHRWIERVRERHDPQHRLVGPHVTFVFPFQAVAAEAVVAHAGEVAAKSAPIPFRLSKAAVVKNSLGPATHLFLLPSEGEDRMHALHARLYSGILAAHRHPTVTFTPHVTAGAFEAADEAADALATLPAFDIAGVLESLVVAEFDGRRVVELQDLPLRG